MGLRLFVITPHELDVGGVEVGAGVVGVDFDGFFDDCAVFGASFGVGLREGVEVDVAQARGVGCEDGFYFFERCEGADGVFNGVVGVAEPGVYVFENHGVVLGEADFDFAVAGIVAEGSVDDFNDFAAVGYGVVEGVGEVVAETGPVLGVIA